ncbi:MAG: hypothetical protein SCH70_05735 [Candidatus Methanoperedens sp.]|nr:hypothetical protein [Candidatus Methanoperedens sp.]
MTYGTPAIPLRSPMQRNFRIFIIELESTYGCIATIRVCALQRR